MGTTVEEIGKQIASGQNRAVQVPQKIPVYVSYFTAWPNKDGKVEFFDDVREEQNLPRFNANGLLDIGVRLRLALGPRRRVEIPAEQRRQIPRLRAAENQFLRLNRTGRINKQLVARLMPAFKRFHGIRINMPLQLPGVITLRPDHAL